MPVKTRGTYKERKKAALECTVCPQNHKPSEGRDVQSLTQKEPNMDLC